MEPSPLDFIDIILPEVQVPYTVPGIQYCGKDIMVVMVYPPIYLQLTRQQYNDYLAKKYNIVSVRERTEVNINVNGQLVPINIRRSWSVW